MGVDGSRTNPLTSPLTVPAPLTLTGFGALGVMNLEEFKVKVRALQLELVTSDEYAGLAPLAEGHASLAVGGLNAAIHHADIAIMFQAQALAEVRR